MVKINILKSKINRKKLRGSQTPGSTKGGFCQANHIDRYMAKSSRSYKNRNYKQWCISKDLKRK